ncbi:helix-turn-helix domain-containing protein [Methylobacterium sp. E-045]|uniref:helix-turn-helix domain-containing protein n=1 Tax=Methylobacterium sp. E-045 TaxID=2836575 RepID=UPI001FB87544|nr:helix-turn-helix domain-containing protein [Methylobacterium sp. E-045]MCJ2131690.1 helix-turn-helix domain-containing protein [Methylobacterium sp. E-045]
MPGILCDRFVAPTDPALLAQSWCRHLAPVFEAELASDADLAAPIALTTYHFGEALIGSVTAPAQRLERSARTIARQGVDHILIQFYTAGQGRVGAARRETEVKASQLVVFDLAQPIVSEAGPVSATNVMLPRKLLGDQITTIENLHGQALDYRSAPVRNLSYTYLSGLVASATAAESHQLRYLSSAAADLCAACFQPDANQAPALDRLNKVAICQFIEQELASESLGIDALIIRFGLSRATLYRLFEEEDGVASHIRERRLLRAMKLLGAEGGRPRISSVAYATGFSDEKTFSRAFRRRFGFLPSEALAEWPVAPYGQDNAPVLLGWMRSLSA